ncbi:MAG: hypothetical protein ACRELE_02840 [Gemmatimonadales bacterium]
MKRTRLLVAGLVVVAAACSSNDNTTASTDATITSDISAAAADGIAEDVDVMSGMDGSIGNSLGNAVANLDGPGDFRPGLTGCSFSGGSFHCPGTLRNGLTVTRTVTFLDAGGQTETAFDPLLTASIHLVADVSGTATHGPWTATVSRHRDFTISGLAGTETTRTVNGSGNETVTNSRDTTNPRAYDLTCLSTVTNVVLPVRSTDDGNGWPISGTITRACTITVTAGPNAGKTTTRAVTVTFNGTSNPTADINGTTFTVDLTAHTATRH